MANKKYFEDIIENRNYPFSFIYGETPSSKLLPAWERTVKVNDTDDEFTKEWIITYRCPKTELELCVRIINYSEFNCIEQWLTFTNNGKENTPIIKNVYTLDTVMDNKLCGITYKVHFASGAPSTAQDYEQYERCLAEHEYMMLSGAHGRSANQFLPFFDIEEDTESIVCGAAWSGQWAATMSHGTDGVLSLKYGLETTNFKLLPGESVKMPGIVVLFEQGKPEIATNKFRNCMTKHFIRRIPGRKDEPYLFCNTCFTRYGAWLNECNEENQISLIRSLKPLGVECVITDAGWFIGGWPDGAGNWDYDPEKYPRGFAPVIKAADECGMKYGLWFELERAVSGTVLTREHPDWLLHNNLVFQKRTMSGISDEETLLNLGIPEARDYIFNIVERYFKEGLSCYRQDFNIDPLLFWRSADDSDRIGITELKYVNGLYEFLDRIRKKYPDVFMDGCASGGRRMDVEMIRRFHTNQKTDYWFRSITDQASLFSLSRYLPSSVFTAHINRLDDYSVDSAIAGTLCLGWICDGEDFDMQTALSLVNRYNEIRPCLNGDFYPLTPFCNRTDGWLASEYCGTDGEKAVVMVFRREHCENDTITVNIKGLGSEQKYILKDLHAGKTETCLGKTLAEFKITIEDRPASAVWSITKCD